MMSHDEWYKRWEHDKFRNACVLRVTNQCDQKCRHCCFRSGPECVGQMSVEMCEKINLWIPHKVCLNIMGGEFSVLDNYPEILIALAKGRSLIRLVTNGFWSRTSSDSDQFLSTLKELTDICKVVDVVVSKDRWHKNSGTFAQQLLEKNNNIGITVVHHKDVSYKDIDPLGRAWDNHIISPKIIRRSCEVMCNMIITEDGMLCKCPFGYFPWKYFSETTWHDAQEYIWGWRSEKLAEGMNCHSCMEMEVTPKQLTQTSLVGKL